MIVRLLLDGAVSGLVAVLLMTLFEIPFWYRLGIKGVVQWQVNEIMISKLFFKPYVEGKRLAWAISMHLAHGIVLGALFSILMGLTLPTLVLAPYIAGLAGLTYSFALWIIVPFSFRHMLQRVARVNFTRSGLWVKAC